jgi:prevent-host-death family protein
VRELRNETGRVIAAIEAGTPVTLTVHGRPVADIVPRRERQERRPSAVVEQELEQVRRLASELGVAGSTDTADYDAGLTSDDF